MADHAQALKITPQVGADAWATLERLRPALDEQGLQALAHQWATGAAKLYSVRAGDLDVMAFALRVDRHPAGDEGVIMAAAGHLEGIDLVASVLPAVEAMFIGCKRVRFHTGVPAVARKMARHGYALRELVCEKEIGNGA